MGRVIWRFLPRALKSFTGHHCRGPTTIGFTPHAGESEIGPKIKTTEAATENFKGANPFSSPACALIRSYPADAPSVIGAGPGASVGATDPGYVDKLCTGTRSRLEHQLKPKIGESRDLKYQHTTQRDQGRAWRTRYLQGKGLPRQAGEPGKGLGHHQKQATKTRGRACRGLRGAEPPRQPRKYDPRRQSVWCQAAR